jgi:two-component system, OmpR family, alkaline phosphatase synthesis response regulator PhoP
MKEMGASVWDGSNVSGGEFRRGEAIAMTRDIVLVVEDSRPMQRTLQRLFESDSLQVQIASDGPSGLELFRKQIPCAVVLDLKLPGLSGKELCREFKTLAASVPIVVLSANAEVEDKVLLLELGADDYVTKPFSPKELLARVRRAMRRTGAAAAAVTQLPRKPVHHEVLTFGDVRINFTSMEAARAGKPVTLTSQEFKLLKYLAASADRVVSREELLNEVWGYQNYPSTRTVDNHILRLRQKLEADPAAPRFLITMHGAGYKFSPGGSAAGSNA